MYNSDHTDSTILQILEDQKESRQEIKEEVNSEDDDDVKKDLKSNITNVKLVDHQGDRYANKMIGKGLFDTSEENIYASKKPSPYGLYLNAPTLTKTSDSTK